MSVADLIDAKLDAIEFRILGAIDTLGTELRQDNKRQDEIQQLTRDDIEDLKNAFDKRQHLCAVKFDSIKELQARQNGWNTALKESTKAKQLSRGVWIALIGVAVTVIAAIGTAFSVWG